MAKTTFSVRMGEALKKHFDEICSDFGRQLLPHLISLPKQHFEREEYRLIYPHQKRQFGIDKEM